MSEKNKQAANYRLAVATTVAVFCMGQIPGSIDAAISKITAAFHLSSTSGLYVTTVACLVSVAFSILLGFIAGKKIGYRPLILFCAGVELLSALFPFLTNNFVVLIVLRGLFGVGFGGMQSLENTVAATLIPVEKRAPVLGAGMFFGFGMNCILQFIGGILADIGWNYVFLNHLLLLLPFILVVIGCVKMDFQADNEMAQQEDIGGTEKLPISVYQVWILIAFVGIFIAPLLVGCSFLSEQINDSATVAGIVAVCFSVGCMFGGICYSKLFEKLKRNALPVFLLVMALGIAGCAFVRSVVLLCVMIFVAGMGFSLTQATGMMILSLSASPKKIAFASAIMMALFNLGMFFSSKYEELVGMVTGDALYMPLYIGAALLLAFAVAYAIFSPLRDVAGGGIRHGESERSK